MMNNSIDTDHDKSCSEENKFVFTSDNFRSPNLSTVGNIVELPIVNVKDNKDLEGYGYLVEDVTKFTVESGNFEIVKWPTLGWRKLDPETGDEAGTTEGDFEVKWLHVTNIILHVIFMDMSSLVAIIISII